MQTFFSKKIIGLLSLFLFTISVTSAQEIVTELKYNDALIFEKHHSQLRAITDTVQLPFIDDFSYSIFAPDHKYPDQNLWMDRDVYVNTTYPVLPPTIGVATFDGLNEFGVPYDTSGVPQSDIFDSNPADSLTSLPIHLETVTPNDSVYLSFFYEKMGIGDFPNDGDSLVLELKKLNGTWKKVWEMNGDAQTPTVIKFTQVMIPIADNSYFFNNFQFRFRNYATTTGNNDHWHIDYVRLNANRSYTDTLLQDVAAVYTPGTILKNYEFMPWTQFKNYQSNELAATFPFVVHNLSSTSFNANNKYSAIETFSPFVHDTMFTNLPTGNSFNFSPQTFQTNNNSIAFDTATFQNDSALILINCKISSDVADINYKNDSVYRVQPFYNYFAHDDGSAEKSYALYSAGARLAYKFHANVADTIRAIQIHFAHITNDVSNKFLSIIVWKKVLPTEQIMYEQDFLHPTYIDSINGFATYVLDTPKAISDTFYVGWLQTSPEYLFVGLDRNTDAHQSIYYKTVADPTFKHSTQTGSIMIRPIVGAKLLINGIKNISENSITVNCYPNPTNDLLHVDVTGVRNAELIFTDLSGRIIQTAEGINSTVYVGNLSPGMYLLTVKEKSNKQSITTRFIKL